MYELLNLPEAPRSVYKGAPLALVVAEVRFPPVRDLLSADILGKFHRSIREAYPLSGETEGVEFEIDLEGSSEPRSRRLPKKVQFWDQGQDWMATIGEGALALEARRYLHFEDFAARFRNLVEALDPFIRPSIVLRLGLRYIDEFRPLAGDLSAVIVPQHLGLLAPGPLQGFIGSCLQQATLTVDSLSRITIRHGKLPRGSVVRPTALPVERLQEPFYVLDIDAFADFPPAEAPALLWDNVSPLLQDYHEAVHRLFHWFMTPEFEQSLTGEKD